MMRTLNTQYTQTKHLNPQLCYVTTHNLHAYYIDVFKITIMSHVTQVTLMFHHKLVCMQSFHKKILVYLHVFLWNPVHKYEQCKLTAL